MNFDELVHPLISGGHALIAAPTGAGKSYFVGACVESLHRAKKPFLILDTKSLNHIGLWYGDKRLKGLARLRIFPGTHKTQNEYISVLRHQPYIIVIPAGGIDIDELIEEYRIILRAVRQLGDPRTIILEEAHNYNSSTNHPDKIIESITREGRGYEIWLWCITQRIADFPKLIWSNCSFTAIMQYRIPQDIAYFTAVLPKFREINQSLSLHDVLLYRQTEQSDNPYTIIPAAAVTRRTYHLG